MREREIEMMKLWAPETWQELIEDKETLVLLPPHAHARAAAVASWIHYLAVMLVVGPPRPRTADEVATAREGHCQP